MRFGRLSATSLIPLILPGVLHFGEARASGNVLPRASSEALGMADANVALASGPAAQIVNPANFGENEESGLRWEAGVLLGQVQGSYSRSALASAATAGDYATKTGYPLLTYAALSRRYSERVTLGFAVDTPHGLNIEWDDHTWDRNFGAPYGAADTAKKAGLTVWRFGPALAVKLDDAWSAGVRLFGQHVRALDENDLSTVEGEGVSYGAQVGTRWRANDFIFGASYTSRTNTEVKGTQSGIHAAAAASLVSGDAKADILLPDRLQVGVAFRLRPDLWWEVDLDRIGWSYYDELTIYQADGTIANAGKNARHTRDTLSFRTGMKWSMSPVQTLHAGVGYDPTPVPERDASPIVSMLRKTHLGLGASRLLDKGVKLDVAYQYIRGHARRIGETDQDNSTSGDTRLYEGTYESKSHVLGISLNASY
jgi:long-subunit fatty acid transport protein